MSQSISLSTKKRELTGRKVKQLRKQGIVPANIFGAGVKSQSIQVPAKEFTKVLQEAGETSVIDIAIEGESKTVPVLIHQVQRHPASDEYIHVDFLQVDLKKKITAQVPVEISGEAPAVKDKGGVLLVAINELEVEALPTDLPDKIEVDISTLAEIGEQIQLSSLKLKGDVTFTADAETAIVIIQEPKVEAEPEPAEAEEGEADEAGDSEDGKDDAEAKPEEKADDKAAESADKKEE